MDLALLPLDNEAGWEGTRTGTRVEVRRSKELFQRVDNCSDLDQHPISNPHTHTHTHARRTFFVTLGIVPLWNPFRVFHSIPSGTSIRRSNCALLVYGNGRSRTRYFSAFLSFFSEMITCDFPASFRFDGSIPGNRLTRAGLVGRLVRSVPPQEPWREKGA